MSKAGDSDEVGGTEPASDLDTEDAQHEQYDSGSTYEDSAFETFADSGDTTGTTDPSSEEGGGGAATEESSNATAEGRSSTKSSAEKMSAGGGSAKSAGGGEESFRPTRQKGHGDDDDDDDASVATSGRRSGRQVADRFGRLSSLVTVFFFSLEIINPSYRLRIARNILGDAHLPILLSFHMKGTDQISDCNENVLTFVGSRARRRRQDPFFRKGFCPTPTTPFSRRRRNGLPATETSSREKSHHRRTTKSLICPFIHYWQSERYQSVKEGDSILFRARHGEKKRGKNRGNSIQRVCRI